MARRPRHPTISNLGRSPSRKPTPPDGTVTKKPGSTTTPPKTVAPTTRPSVAAIPARAATEVLPPKPDAPERGLVVGWMRAAFTENLGLKFLSLVLAVTVFLLVNTDRDREITAHMGVAYSLPDDKVLVSGRIDEIRVTIKGPWRKLRGFDERELDRVTLDLRKVQGGDVPITPDMIQLPTGLTVTSISPRTVSVVFDKRVEKIVEVSPTFVGRPAHGYVVAEVRPNPPTVRVRGAEGLLRQLSSIRTGDIRLEGRTDVFKTDTQLVPPESVELVAPGPIVVQVSIDEELVSRKATNLTVQVRGDGTTAVDQSKWIVSPPQVDITLTGALLAVERAKDVAQPVVRVVGDGRTRNPNEAVEVLVEGLPAGVGVRVTPERVRVAPVR